jgi:release factor glutamine methyltransferase
MTWGKYKETVIENIRHLYDKEESLAIVKILMEKRSLLKGSQQILLKNVEMNQGETAQGQLDLENLQSAMPIQYVLQEAWFLNFPFKVTKDVLIPRPETEELILWATSLLKNHSINKTRTVLDVGCGSGCIAISLSKMLTNTTVLGIDISQEALKIAKENADNLDADIALNCIDFLDEKQWDKLGKFDLIISNPPYIPENEAKTMDNHVVQWEPSAALFTPSRDPLLFYRKLLHFTYIHLEDNGLLLVECHQDFAEQVLTLYLGKGFRAELKKDIFENNRMILCEKCFETNSSS